MRSGRTGHTREGHVGTHSSFSSATEIIAICSCRMATESPMPLPTGNAINVNQGRPQELGRLNEIKRGSWWRMQQQTVSVSLSLCLSVSLSLCLSVSLAHHCIQRGMPRIEPASIASSFASLS